MLLLKGVTCESVWYNRTDPNHDHSSSSDASCVSINKAAAAAEADHECCPTSITQKRARLKWQREKHALPYAQKPISNFKRIRTMNSATEATALHCACGGTCRKVESDTFYTDANTERIGKHKLAVLEKNSVYRMHDLLIHGGVRFRRDSISVLCEPTFRNTLLREVLTSTTTIDGGRPLTARGSVLEALVSERSDGVDAAVNVDDVDDVGGTRSHHIANPGQGFALAAGVFGPSKIALGNIESNLVALAKALVGMHAREPDQCHGADDDELVVPLRLGDSTSNVESARDSIDKYLSSSCGKGIKKALVTGVLHYGLAEVTHLSLHPTKYAPVKDNVTGYRFARTVAKDTHAEQIVDAIVAHLEDVHSLTVKVRSESNADKDMCLSVFSLHILDGITMHVLGTNNASEARLPGQTLLRNDVVALFHSHNLASASTNIVRNLPALRNRLPCSHAVPEKSRFTSKKLQWESVLVQYGRLSNAHFAMLCASSCMARRSSASTMCAAPSEPLGCTELVGRGPGRDHSLVCMTTSELDAVQAATVQPWGKLFVMADHSTNSAVSALSGGGGGGGTDGVIAAKQQLLGKWQRERGPSWPESNTIASYTTVDNVAHNPEMLIDEYAAAFRNRKDHNVFSDQKQRAVRRYKKLVGPLSACCGAQMEPSYRLHLHALHALLDTIPENTNGRRSRKKMERRGKQKGGSSSDKQLNAEGSVDAAHECELVDVDALEKKMMENRVFQKCNSIDVIAMLSKYDGRLTGDYCSRARAATIKDRLVANDYRYRQL